MGHKHSTLHNHLNNIEESNCDLGSGSNARVANLRKHGPLKSFRNMSIRRSFHKNRSRQHQPLNEDTNYIKILPSTVINNTNDHVTSNQLNNNSIFNANGNVPSTSGVSSSTHHNFYRNNQLPVLPRSNSTKRSDKFGKTK